MKFITIIPARRGSKGIKNKNMKLIYGKPLVHYTIQAAKRSNLKEIYVTSDCHKTLSYAEKFNVNTINRPKYLANDSTAMLPVIKHAVRKAKIEFDAIIILQPTSPLRNQKHIRKAIKIFKSDLKCDSLLTVTKIPHNMEPYSSMYINKKGYLNDFINQNRRVLRRQEKQIFYARNGPAICILKKEVLKASIYGKKIKYYEMPNIESIDVDNVNDFNLVKKLLKN